MKIFTLNDACPSKRHFVFSAILLSIFCLNGGLFSASRAYSEPKVAILAFCDKTKSRNFGYLSTSIADVVDTKMQKRFEYRRIAPKKIEKLKPCRKKLTAGKIDFIAGKLNADIVIYGKYTFSKKTKKLSIKASMHITKTNKFAQITPVSSKADSGIFQIIDKISKEIVSEVNKIAEDANTAASANTVIRKKGRGPASAQELATLTALFKAVKAGDLAQVKQLMKQEINLNIRDNRLFSALHWAVYKKHAKVIAFLVKKGANANVTDNTGATPLHWAAFRGHNKIIKLLVKKGANVNIKDKERKTALDWAVGKRRPEAAKLLKSLGAK